MFTISPRRIGQKKSIELGDATEFMYNVISNKTEEITTPLIDDQRDNIEALGYREL
jgi:hypothetical protein